MTQIASAASPPLSELIQRVTYDAPCFVGIADGRFRPIFLNAYGRRMMGLAEDMDVHSLRVADFFHADDRQAVRGLAIPALLRDGRWEGEYRFRNFTSGQGEKVGWTAFLLKNADGETLGVGCFANDLSERAAIEARLRESGARLESAVDLVGLSCYRWNPQTGALDWDEKLKALWGIPTGVEPDQELWLSGVHPDDRDRVREAARRAIDPDGDGVYAIEYRVVSLQDNSERWISTSGRTDFEGRRPVSFTGAVLDITHQKQVEAKLRRSEAYLATILRQLPVGVSVFDLEGRQVLGNTAAKRFKVEVMPSADAATTVRWQGVQADGSPLPTSEYPGARALRGDTSSPGPDFRYMLADGSQIWTRVSAAPLRDEDGLIQGVVSIIEDIDEQRRREAQLRESEERFRRFAENSSDLLWIVDADALRLDYLSPGFQQAWGVRPGDAIADVAVWNDCIHPEDRAVRDEILGRVLTQGEAVTHEYRIVRPDGSVRWIRDTTFPIRNADGRVIQLGGIAHDLSRREGLSVYLVEPAGGAREGKAGLLRGAGRRVVAFASEKAFLDVAAALSSGCVFVRTDDTSAAPFTLALALKSQRTDMPVIFEAELGANVVLAVSAMKAGAADVLQTPAAPAIMLAAVASALAYVGAVEIEEHAVDLARTQIALMSPREREVLGGLLSGGTNKTIARDLGISPRTVEIHRARVMERLGAHTLPEAVMAAASAGLKPVRNSKKNG